MDSEQADALIRDLEELSLGSSPLLWVLHVDDISDGGKNGEKHANAQELMRVTDMIREEQAFELVSLSCAYEIKAEDQQKPFRQKGGPRFYGEFILKALVKQICVVTLDPLETLVEETFFQEFSSKRVPRRDQEQQDKAEDLSEISLEEPPVPLIDGKIPLGPLVYQILSMAIDLNPRKPGAVFVNEQGEDEPDSEGSRSAFAVLKDYKPQKD